MRTRAADDIALAGYRRTRSAAKRLMNRLASGGGAAAQFAAGRAEIGVVVDTPNQVDAVMAHVEQRPLRCADPG